MSKDKRQKKKSASRSAKAPKFFRPKEVEFEQMMKKIIVDYDSTDKAMKDMVLQVYAGVCYNNGWTSATGATYLMNQSGPCPGYSLFYAAPML